MSLALNARRIELLKLTLNFARLIIIVFLKQISKYAVVN